MDWEAGSGRVQAAEQAEDFRLYARISGGSRNASSNPMPQAGTLRMSSQPTKGAPLTPGLHGS
jgi:hypothetical protein